MVREGFEKGNACRTGFGIRLLEAENDNHDLWGSGRIASTSPT